MRALAIVLSVLLASGTAHAAEVTQADQLFSEGRDLLEKGRFAEACEKFRRSEELAPAIGTLINLGYCYEQIARYRSAMDAYAEAESLAKQAKDEKRAAFARERFTTVEPKALKLVVRVADAAASGVEVKRNNTVVPPSEWGVPVAVDPEDFVVTATAPGKRPWRGAVIGRGEGAMITLVIPALEDDRAGVRPDAPPAPAGAVTLGTKRLAAIGLGGAALATIGAGTALAFAAKSRYDDSLAHCDDAGCDERGLSEQDGAVSQGNVATVLFAIGALCIGGGIYLWLTGGEDAVTKAARAGRPGVLVW